MTSSKSHEFDTLIYLDVIVSRVQYAWHLTLCQAQDSMSMACMLDSRRLHLAMCQAQDSMSMACMLDPRRLNLTINQVQDNYHPLMACSRV
jgi:hypothetical protein